MSGDHGLRINLPASLQALRGDTSLHLHLVGDSRAINAAIGSAVPARASIVHAPDIIPMDAKPSAVLRQSDHSSMRVALLSNGKEEAKGNAQIQQARHSLSADQGLNFVGFVEADDLFENLADVIVCHGLLGNVALKSMEGTARLLASRLHASHDRTPYRRILAMLSRTVLQELRDAMNPELHNGAYLFGLQGVVVKSHGASSQHRFSAALQQAARCVQHKMVPQMAHYLDNQ